MPRAIGIGAGGHAKILVELLRCVGGWELAGFTDRRTELRGKMVLGVPILGDDSLLPQLREQGIEGAFVGVGAIREITVRKKLFELGRRQGFKMIGIISPAAYVSSSVRMGDGVAILPGAIVNTEVCLGDNVNVYSGAIVEHDSVVGDHTHISPGVHVAGGVQIGSGAFIGIGATIIQGIRIGPGAVVGAGSTVIRDVPPGATVVGVPARVIAESGV